MGTARVFCQEQEGASRSIRPAAATAPSRVTVPGDPSLSKSTPKSPSRPPGPPSPDDRGPDEATLDRLIEAARGASSRAYAPYSRFPVGAAILAGSGRIHVGCNVENASYGLTICAERNAVGRAVAEGDVDVAGVVVYTPTPSPTPPCGACRQVLREFGPRAWVVSVAEPDPGSRILRRWTLAELLPEAFGPPRHP